MAREEISRQFDVIEDKVEKLIERCKSLEAKNSEFKNKIEKLEQELQERHETEKVYLEQKDLIRGKIDSLIGKLSMFTDSESF